MSESIAERVAREVLRWDGVSAKPHRFGGVEFRVAQHEIGHLHGDRVADLPVPLRVKEELVASGLASPHHHLPHTGWVSRYIGGPDDVPAVIDLLRRNYDRIRAASVHRRSG